MVLEYSSSRGTVSAPTQESSTTHFQSWAILGVLRIKDRDVALRRIPGGSLPGSESKGWQKNGSMENAARQDSPGSWNST